MSATVAMPQERLLKALLKEGRWRNKSEIVRYGIELVRREVERDKLAPMPPGELAAEYQKLSRADHDDDRAMGGASAYPVRGEMD